MSFDQETDTVVFGCIGEARLGSESAGHPQRPSFPFLEGWLSALLSDLPYGS